MNHDHDILNPFRNELASASATLKQCTAAVKGFKTFKHSPQGLEFCATQLLQGAAMLRDHAEQLANLAEGLHSMLSDMPQQLELDDINENGCA